MRKKSKTNASIDIFSAANAPRVMPNDFSAGGILEQMEPVGDCLVRVVVSGAEFLVDDSLQEKLAALMGQHMTICHVFGKWGCGAMPE